MKGYSLEELQRRWDCSEKTIHGLLLGPCSLVQQGFLEERDGLYYVTAKGIEASHAVGGMAAA